MQQEIRYDRMSRKDFSRKSNSYASVLMNDNRYSNFRFAKRSLNLNNSPTSPDRYGTALGDCGDSTGYYHQQHPYSASGASLLRASNSAVRSAKMMSSLAINPSNHQPSQTKLMVSSFQLPNNNRCNTSADFS